MTQADNVSALRKSLDPGEGPSATNLFQDHPSYTTLRAHAILCERCAIGDDCPTGTILSKIYDQARTLLAAAATWESAEVIPL